MEPGSRLGPYEVLSEIGKGGMGAVYRARDRALNRDVAVKVLLPSVANDPERLARFSREAQILASLNHPNIASIYGFEELNGVRALVMELVEGPTLADRITTGPIAPDEVLAIARQIADALEAAHEQGIVHRDLKPANIKVRADGAVKVLDFGLAKAMESASGPSMNASMSQTMAIQGSIPGTILGTAAYMSPEQASGKPVDKRTDIWAFGVVLWEMLTGRQMFQGETLSHVLAAVLTGEPDIGKVPPRFHGLLARCLAKDPRRRLRDIGDALSLAEEPAVAMDTGVTTRRWPVVGWALAAFLTVALVASMWPRSSTVTNSGDSSPLVRFQIERSAIDPYNNAATAFAVSPDGKLLAHYVSRSDGQTILAVRALATGDTLEVPGSSGISPSAPFWSADSGQVVYANNVGTLVFNVATGTTRELCPCRFAGGSWNRDGVILLGATNNSNEPIRRLSLDDRTPVAVTKVDDAKGQRDISPVFLPDGQRFLFTRVGPGSARVTYLGTLGARDGGEPKRIADGSRSLFAMTPDGLHSYVLGIDAGGLVSQPLDMGTMTVFGEPVIVASGAAAASVSSNGVLVTSASADFPTRVPTWFDRKGNTVGTLGAPGALQSVNLSPDGRTLAVGEAAAQRANGRAALWLRDPAGANRQLTFSSGSAVNDPAWSPDGTRMVVSLSNAGAVNLWERATDGSGAETRLFPASRNTFVNDWSRDGRWLIYTFPKTDDALLDLDLWVVPMDGSQERKPIPYLTTSAREAQAEFSPDGRFVAYTSIEGGQPEVFVKPFPNAANGQWRISTAGGAEPHWNRDGTELFYIAGQTLMAARVRLQPTFSNDAPARLFDAPVQPWYINDSDRWQVAPDGKRFLLLVPAGKRAIPSIDVLVNWTP